MLLRLLGSFCCFSLSSAALMFLLLLLLVVVEERLRTLWGEVHREGARALAALGAAGPSPNGGNGVIRGTTRRRHAANQLLMLQNPHRRRHGGRRRAWLRCPWAVAGPGRASRRRAERSSRRGRRAGGPPPTGTPSSPAQQGTPSSPAQQAAGYAKGAGTEVPAPCRLTQPLPRRGSGRMILSPGDGDASTGTCRPRRPLPGPLRRSGRRSRCAQGAGPGRCSAWWPGRRARRNRSSRR